MTKPITFFLIDDDEDDRELFELALERTSSDINYKCSASGCEALDLLKSGELKPDFIFLDLNMPQMSGRECLAELKENIQLSHIPVVIFSTSSDPRDKRETQEMGAIGFMTKPSKMGDLTVLLEKFIASHITKIETSFKNNS